MAVRSPNVWPGRGPSVVAGRLEREQLARDPRADTYQQMWRRHALRCAEPIIELLEVLRDRIQAEPEMHQRSLLARLLSQSSASLTSDCDTAQDLARLVREHWSIEAHHQRSCVT